MHLSLKQVTQTTKEIIMFAFTINHTSTHSAWNSVHNFDFTGTPEAAFLSHGADSPNSTFGWELEDFIDAAKNDRTETLCGVYLVAKAV